MVSDLPRLRWLRLWLASAWLLVAVVVYLSLAPAPPDVDLPQGDKVVHVLAYAVLMFWFSQIYDTTASRVGVALGLVLLGVTLEFLQGYGGERMFELPDMIANTVGVALGWLSAPPRTGNLFLRIESLVSV